jgi:hypothetical protein
MRAAEIARVTGVALWAFMGAAAPMGGCSWTWSDDACRPDDYEPTGPEVESVEECPPFPASCPVDCDASRFLCTEPGLRCEDCARVQAWLDQNREEVPCIEVDTEWSLARGLVLSCGGSFY